MKKGSFIFSLLIVCLLASSCGNRGPVRPERDCPITKLLLNEADFLRDTIVDTVITPLADYPQESAGIDATYHADLISQSVARWYYFSVAIEENEKWMKIAFNPSRSSTGVYDTPPELSDLNFLPADQIHVACAEEKNIGYRCRTIARYDEYQIQLFSDISESGVTYEIFRNLVLKINDKMVACLNK